MKRRRMPSKRRSTVVTARVSGHKIFVTMGCYADGSLGEVFIDMHKAGSTFRGVMHCFAQLFSIALQYGVPLEVLVKALRGVRFEPCGDVTGHDTIGCASSLMDYIAQVLAQEYGIQTKVPLEVDGTPCR